jgi:hypothetical protein
MSGAKKSTPNTMGENTILKNFAISKPAEFILSLLLLLLLLLLVRRALDLSSTFISERFAQRLSPLTHFI